MQLLGRDSFKAGIASYLECAIGVGPKSDKILSVGHIICKKGEQRGKRLESTRVALLAKVK